MIQPFETLFAVPLECNECIKTVSAALHEIPGIDSVDANLKEQLVSVKGTGLATRPDPGPETATKQDLKRIAPPSAIVTAIQSTGRDAIVRGSGLPNSAAVSILETHAVGHGDGVRGLARMVQAGPNTIIDLTVHDLSPGMYFATIRESGDLSDGPISTGGVWTRDGKQTSGTLVGKLGQLEVGKSGIGSVMYTCSFEIGEIIGRSCVLSQERGRITKNDPDTVVGIVARSAGVWENTKTVCACSGKSLWTERKEKVERGMV